MVSKIFQTFCGDFTYIHAHGCEFSFPLTLAFIKILLLFSSTDSHPLELGWLVRNALNKTYTMLHQYNAENKYPLFENLEFEGTARPDPQFYDFQNQEGQEISQQYVM